MSPVFLQLSRHFQSSSSSSSLPYLSPSSLSRFSDLSESEKARTSSPVIDVEGNPSFKVEINGKETILSVSEITVKFLRSLFLTAKDFLSGVPISGSVLSIPLFYSSSQISALKSAATQAGLIVLQLIPSPGAALVAYGLTSQREDGGLPSHPDEDGLANGDGSVKDYSKGKELDRTILVLDMGGTSTTSTLLSSNSGLYSILESSSDLALGGRNVDDSLVEYLAKEFTKKTKINIGKEDRRAWQKLRNEAEVTKRALSASGSAQCSVESLAEGCDFSASVNRVRLGMLANPIYGKVLDVVKDSLKKAGLQPVQVDEVSQSIGSRSCRDGSSLTFEIGRREMRDWKMESWLSTRSENFLSFLRKKLVIYSSFSQTLHTY